MKPSGFILFLLVAVANAYFFPAGLEWLQLDLINEIGIGLIFFFYGLKIAPSDFKLKYDQLPVHLLIHFCSFVGFPLLVLAMLPLFPTGTEDPLWLALLFLGALPSTVSSSVVMVSIARGNVPIAIISASISGLLGVFLTPVWLSFFIGSTAQYDLLKVISELFLQILAPLILGLSLQKWLGAFAQKNRKWISLYDKTIIGLIVYSSFASAFISDLFSKVPGIDLLKILVCVLLLFALIYLGIGYFTKKWGWKKENRITAQFCGSKKSLVHGSAMATIFFGSTGINALFLLPIMLYHMLQLLIISYVAEKRGKQVLDENAR